MIINLSKETKQKPMYKHDGIVAESSIFLGKIGNWAGHKLDVYCHVPTRGLYTVGGDNPNEFDIAINFQQFQERYILSDKAITLLRRRMI